MKMIAYIDIVVKNYERLKKKENEEIYEKIEKESEELYERISRRDRNA
jgi:hypothetical protein